jgi:Coenzyme PQQ synthesis protein D (PqqD)
LIPDPVRVDASDEWPGERAPPRRREGVSAAEENLALQDEVGQLLISLYTSAASVWELCDGRTSVESMVPTFADAHPSDAAVMGEDVRQTLRKPSWAWMKAAGSSGH